MEERLKILKLLEDGKINSEEAARLLEALSDRPAWEPRHFGRKVVMPDMEKFFDKFNFDIASAFGDRVKHRELKFTGKKLLRISSVSGTVDVTGTAGPEITIKAEGSGFQRIREDDSEVKLHYLSSDLLVSIPKQTGFELRAVSGDINLTDYEGAAELVAVSGDIELHNLSGKLKIKTVSGDIAGSGLSSTIEAKTKSGDIDLDFSELTSAELETRTGDVALTIPKEGSLTVELSTESGKIDCDLPLTGEKRTSGHLAGSIGNGKGRLKVTIEDKGSITIKVK
jgi:DUF4097 and DUF4098 domain-containing protein YvlB